MQTRISWHQSYFHIRSASAEFKEKQINKGWCDITTKYLLLKPVYCITACACFYLNQHVQYVHVNVTGDWKAVKLEPPPCVSLSVKRSQGTVVCECMHDCIHSFSPPCAQCAGLSVHGRTFLNYISALPDYLHRRGSWVVVTARMSNEKRRIKNLLL